VMRSPAQELTHNCRPDEAGASGYDESFLH